MNLLLTVLKKCDFWIELVYSMFELFNIRFLLFSFIFKSSSFVFWQPILILQLVIMISKICNYRIVVVNILFQFLYLILEINVNLNVFVLVLLKIFILLHFVFKLLLNWDTCTNCLILAFNDCLLVWRKSFFHLDFKIFELLLYLFFFDVDFSVKINLLVKFSSYIVYFKTKIC